VTAFGSYSQAIDATADTSSDTLCFSISQIRDKTAKLEAGQAAVAVVGELRLQITQCDSMQSNDSLIKIDFVNAIVTYVKDSVLSSEQLVAANEIASIYGYYSCFRQHPALG